MADARSEFNIAAKFRLSLAGWTEASPDLSSDQTSGPPCPSPVDPVFSVHTRDANESAGPTRETSS